MNMIIISSRVREEHHCPVKLVALLLGLDVAGFD